MHIKIDVKKQRQPTGSACRYNQTSLFRGFTVSDRFKVLPQYLLPKQRLTTFAGRVAGARGGSMTTRLIRWFVGKYGVNMDEAENSDITSYTSFNDFFTRSLK